MIPHESKGATREIHGLCPGFESDDSVLCALYDALMVHTNRHIDNDAKRTAGAQHGDQKFILGSENAYLARWRDQGQLDHSLPQQPKPP